MEHSIENFNKDKFNTDMAQDLVELLKTWSKKIPDFPLDYEPIRKMKVFDELEKNASGFPHILVLTYGDDFYNKILQNQFEQLKLSIAENLRLQLFKEMGKGDTQKGCNRFIKGHLTSKPAYNLLYNQCPIFREFIDGIAQKYKDEFRHGRKAIGFMDIVWAIFTAGLSLLTDALVNSFIKRRAKKASCDPVFGQIIFIFIESQLWKE